MDRVEAQLPQTPIQWINLSLITMVLVLIFISGIAVAQHQADDQYISNDELKQNLAELQSYSAEAGLLSSRAQSNSAPRAYTEAYSAALAKATESVADKLSQHPHKNTLKKQVAQTIDIANQLSGSLSMLGKQPNDQLPPHFSKTFEELADQSQTLQEAL